MSNMLLLDKRTQVLVENYIPSPEILGDLSCFFSMFADETRLKMLSALAISEMCVTDLSEVLEINQTTISQWLLGNKKPNFDSIYTIYKKFNITPNELFGIDN